MKALRLWVFFIPVFFGLLFPSNLIAKQDVTECSDRYVTLVNPIRDRSLWVDKTVNPLKNQYELVEDNNFSATWLLQYDVLKDKELLKEINNFNENQERGVFLEVSEKYADEARVIYPYDVPWFSPNAVFLSSYSQSGRRRLIDRLFEDFKVGFGYYPRSVGAWWIDSYSLNYLKEKYNIKAAMIVADQKTTDNYGVWGQWWGVPFYPSKANILTPASSLKNKQDVVVIQWAQRDPVLALGEGTKFSNSSLQANDYTERGKDTRYFKQLVDVYLSCNNSLGQITVGLETGMEGVKSFDEYQNQLKVLKQTPNLESVTMSNFADNFRNMFADYPKQNKISFGDSTFNLTPLLRSNKYFNEEISYNSNISFADYFVKDTDKFLNRQLPEKVRQKNAGWFPWFLLVSLGLFVVSYKKGLIESWAISSLFSVAAFGLIFKSFYQNGWKVYFGPQVPNLPLVQVLLILVSFLIVLGIHRLIRVQKILWLLPLTFGLDFIAQLIRISNIAGKYYFGFALDNLRFIGFSIKPFANINFINQDFPSFVSAALLRIRFDHVWDNLIASLVLYPLTHIAIAIILGFILSKLPNRLKKVTIGILVVLFLLHLVNILNADPRQVLPILIQ